METVLANHIPVPVENECHSYFPVVDGLEGTLTRVFEDIGLGGEFENFENDIEQLRDKFFERATETDIEAHNLRIDVLKSPFYRNKAAYIVGRVVTENNHYPLLCRC